MADAKMAGRVVVITGASSGFGKGVAVAFARLGAGVVLAARRAELLEELAQECRALGVRALAVPTDVSNHEEVAKLAQAAVAEFGRIDVWLNDAGAAVIGNYDEVPLADHFKVIATDLLGTMAGSHVALKQFRAQGEGTLINVASMLGKVPAPYYASYCAAKHGVIGLCGALRQELAEQKLERIHVCAVMPMAMDTPFFEHAANYTGHKAVPIPPMDEAQKVIDVIVDLAFHPKDEVPVGKGSTASLVSHNLMPGLTEHMMAKNTRVQQMEKAPAAAPTPGGLQQPAASGTGVSNTAYNKPDKQK